MSVVDCTPSQVPRPGVGARVREGAASWRIAARLARRDVRRHATRALLTVLLIAVPSATLMAGAFLVHSGSPTDQFQRRYGTVDAVVFGDAAPVVRGLAPGAVATTYSAGYRRVQRAGSSISASVDVTNVIFDGTGVADFVEVREGRTPAAGEAAISAGLARWWGIGIGDVLELDEPAGTWTVTAFVRLRDDHRTDLLALPGAALAVPAARISNLRTAITGVRPGTIEREPRTSDAGVVVAGSDPAVHHRPSAWAYVAGVLALVVAGIVAAAAFATSSRAQLVTAGQLSATGASPEVMRRTYALQGAFAGAVGAVMGVLGGCGLALAARPLAAAFVHRDIGTFSLPWREAVAMIAVSTLVGVGAATAPTRGLTRTPVLALLAGRRPTVESPRVHRLWSVALLAIGSVIVGYGATFNDGARDGDRAAQLVLVGVLCLVAGAIAALALVVGALARLADHVPLTWRLALRTMARHRTRSVAMLAAIAVFVGLAVATCAVAEASARDAASRGDLPQGTALIGSLGTGPDPTRSAPIPEWVRAEVRRALPDASITPMHLAVAGPTTITEIAPAQDGRPGAPVVATPELLELLGVDTDGRATLEREGAIDATAGTVPPWPASAGVRPAVAFRADGDRVYRLVAVPVEVDRTPFGGSLTVVTASHARSLGLDLVEQGGLVQGDSLHDDGARRIANDFGRPLERAGLSVRWATPVSDVAQVTWIARSVAISVAMVLVLALVAIALALGAADGRAEQRCMRAVGASPAVLRRQFAAQAATLSLVGVAVGVALAVVPLWLLAAGSGLDQSRTIAGRVWPAAIAISFVVPLAATAVGWGGAAIAVRRTPESAADSSV